MSKKLFGAAQVVFDGEVLQTLTGAQLDVGGRVRTARNGPVSTHGFSESAKEATVECEIVMPAGFEVQRLRDAEDVTITFKCDTGQSYVIRNGWTSEPPTATDGDDAKWSVKFAGPAAEEVL